MILFCSHVNNSLIFFVYFSMIQGVFKFRSMPISVSVSALYLLRVRFRQYLFPYSFPGFLYSFPLLQKNVKTNIIALSSVRFRSVFIPTTRCVSCRRAWVLSTNVARMIPGATLELTRHLPPMRCWRRTNGD